jgi:hypothetical protein
MSVATSTPGPLEVEVVELGSILDDDPIVAGVELRDEAGSARRGA